MIGAAVIKELEQMVPPTMKACAFTNMGLSLFFPGIRWLAAPTIGAAFSVTMVLTSITSHHVLESQKQHIEKENLPFYENLALASVIAFSVLLTGICVKKGLSLIGREISYRAAFGLALFDFIPFVLSAPTGKASEQ